MHNDSIIDPQQYLSKKNKISISSVNSQQEFRNKICNFN
jgi:hypothetical protein